jgi:hypothetical protein
MIGKDFNSLIDLVKAFPTEQSCIDHLTELRWNGYVVSPFDPTSKVYKCKGNKYRCKNTGKYFNVRTNTLFDNTKIELIKWFMAIWLVTGHKKGISSLQLSRDIDVTQKTAWFMLQRIRKCFGCENDHDLNNEVEIDETFVGGKNKNRHADKKVPHSTGRAHIDKTPVLGMVERGGKVVARKVESTSVEHITPEVVRNVKDAMVYTDEWVGYKQVNRIYDHLYVKHNEGEYVNGRIYTNTIEGFWSILKRGIVGIYHFTSRKHIQRYVDEFVFRYNTRQYTEMERFNLLLQNTEHRLTYKELIYG